MSWLLWGPHTAGGGCLLKSLAVHLADRLVKGLSLLTPTIDNKVLCGFQQQKKGVMWTKGRTEKSTLLIHFEETEDKNVCGKGHKQAQAFN